jgi:hypothetical protein
MNDVKIVAYEIAEAFSKQSDIPFIRRMENLVIQGRATALQQKYDKYGRFPASSEASITLSMKQVPPAECLTDEIECTVARTIYKVPRPLRKSSDPIPFSFVGSMNQEVSFIFVKPEEVKSILCGTRFIKTKSMYAYFNDYIYTFNHDAGKITIRDVFADPRELLDLLDCNEKPCTTDIELEEDMKRLIKMFVYEELRQFNIIPLDKQVKLNEEI